MRKRKFLQRTGAQSLKTSIYQVDVSLEKQQRKVQRQEADKYSLEKKFPLYQMPTMPDFQQFFSTKNDCGWTDQMYEKIMPDDIDQWIDLPFEENYSFF